MKKDILNTFIGASDALQRHLRPLRGFDRHFPWNVSIVLRITAPGVQWYAITLGLASADRPVRISLHFLSYVYQGGMWECLCRYSTAMAQAENVLHIVGSKLYGAVAFNKRLICSWPDFSWEKFRRRPLKLGILFALCVKLIITRACFNGKAFNRPKKGFEIFHRFLRVFFRSP